jgi:O-antigen/teichoic acid export membrane protein
MTALLQGWIVAKHRELVPAGSLRARFTLGIVWSLAGAIVSRGFLLAASVVCARFLGKEGFGALGMIQSTVGMFGIFAGLGLGLTATKYVAEFRRQDPAKAGRILALSAFAAFISGGVITMLLILLAPYLAKNVLATPQLAAPLAIGSGLVFFGAMNGAQTGALAGFEAFRTIARVNVISGVASFPLIVLGVWRGGLQGAVWGSVAALAINWALNNRALRRECANANVSYQFASCHRELRILHRFSLPAFLASIVVGPTIWACNALLVHQPDGYAELGIYSAADKWRLLILFVPTSLAGTTLPMLSNLYGAGDSDAYTKVLNLNLLLNLALTAFLAIIVSACALPVLSIYGTSYRSAWPILLILAFSAIPEALNNILGYAMISSGSIWWRLWFDVLLATVLMGFGWWAIPRWGAEGLAVAYGLAFSATALGLLLFMRSRSPQAHHPIPETSG